MSRNEEPAAAMSMTPLRYSSKTTLKRVNSSESMTIRFGKRIL